VIAILSKSESSSLLSAFANRTLKHREEQRGEAISVNQALIPIFLIKWYNSYPQLNCHAVPGGFQPVERIFATPAFTVVFL